MALITVTINNGVPDKEPVHLKVGRDEIEWVSGSGAQWDVEFVRGPRPGKKSPFGTTKYKVKPRKKSGPQVGTKADEEYKYNISGALTVPNSVKGKKDRKLKITVDPTVIIDR